MGRPISKFCLGIRSMFIVRILRNTYRGADNLLARPGRKQSIATEDFDVHIS